ncbi:MAG: DHH family phosphoesterase [Methanomassiliicoccales archaeon]|nr:MAG: DHH family phosphoesterase [Methanomassiliicoccales archaeon]
MIEDILDELESGTKCVLLHVNADPDALGCAMALSLVFPNVSIGAVGGLSKNGKLLQRRLGLEVIEEPEISIYDKIVVVDCASSERLGRYQEKLTNPIVIDHHQNNYDWNTKLSFVDEKKSSCGELVYQILKQGKKRITHSVGLALLTGILTDTGKFTHADAGTLKTFAQIMEESGVDMDEVLSIFAEEHETDYSRRISRLKGAQRLRYQSTGGFIVALSQVGSFESSVCGAILSLGADCAFVGSQRDDVFRISGRATQTLVKNGFTLGNLMTDIANENGCEGGGHDGAAGINGVGDVEAMLNICMKRALDAVKDMPGY